MEREAPSDAELVEACRRGDDAAFESLYHRHRDWVVSVAYRFCGRREDALDVLQETFAYLLARLPGLVLTARFRTFLYPAIKHRALDRLRSERRQVPLETEPLSSDALPGELRELIESLSPLHQEVVWLRFADGLDLKEIAEALQIPLGTVKSRLHTAIAALRKKLADD
jgi:RNA polymerase sigma-70 factor (ECF subfamily)